MTALEKLFLDLVDPLLVPGVVVFEAIVVLIEAVVMFFLVERNLRKALVASFSANLVTGVLSIVYLLFSWATISTTQRFASMIVAALLINMLVEAAVLRLLFFRAVDMKKLLKVSAVMNLASYAILIIYFLYLFASQTAA